MARTPAAGALTETHRQAQLRVRAQALRDFTRLWPLWQGDGATFQQLLAASMPLVRAYHAMSSTLAAGYYDTFRAAEQVGGAPAVRVAPALDEDTVRGTLHLVGLDMTRRAIAAGLSPQAAQTTALVRTSGTVTRFALAGGRDTLLLSSAEDRQARGWARVTGGKACAFCAMLATRGAVYLSEGTADFEAHDHCTCSVEVHYDGADLPAATQRYRDLYDQAQREARESRQGAAGTANDALNNFRRLVSRQ